MSLFVFSLVLVLLGNLTRSYTESSRFSRGDEQARLAALRGLQIVSSETQQALVFVTPPRGTSAPATELVFEKVAPDAVRFPTPASTWQVIDSSETVRYFLSPDGLQRQVDGGPPTLVVPAASGFTVSHQSSTGLELRLSLQVKQRIIPLTQSIYLPAVTL